MTPTYLIACSASKRPVRCSAKRLYTGELFVRARILVALAAADWAILSAKHGLLRPDDLVEPYDQTIGKRKDERTTWARRVAQQLLAAYPQGTHFVILASEAYRAPFELCGRELSPVFTWEAPLRGLAIGLQKQWLARAAAAEAA